LKILPYDIVLLEAKYKFMHSYVYKNCPCSFYNMWTTNAEREGTPALRNDHFFAVLRICIRMNPHDFGLLDPHPESAFQMRIPDADADPG
jgi:hypothetical protein